MVLSQNSVFSFRAEL